MGRATLARQKANGHIGQHRTDKLYDAGLVVIEAAEYERLKARIAELERRNKLLSDLTGGAAERNDVAAQVLKEAMTR